MAIVFDLDKIPFEPHTVTLVCGYYDLLHAGHIAFLEACKKVSEALVVGVNSDEICKRVNGTAGPIINEKDRAYILSKLNFIDYIYINTKLLHQNNGYILKKLKPKAVIFSSGEKAKKAKSAEETFIKQKMPHIGIQHVPRQRTDISTTDLITKIKQAF